jgi:hypothetical protein
MPVLRRRSSKSKTVRSIARASLEMLEGRRMLSGTVATWSGAGTDTNFSDAANWVGDVAPTTGQDVDFPSSASATTVTIDTPSAEVGNVEVGAGYTFQSASGTSNALKIDGDVTATNDIVTFSNPVVLGSENPVFDVYPTSLIEMNGVISDGGLGYGINKQGNGELEFNATDTFSGTLQGNGGILIDNSPLAAALQIHTGTDYFGSSSVQAIQGFDGAFSPATFDVDTNAVAPATMTVTDGIDFDTPSNATIVFDIDGPTDSSNLNVTGGTITLGSTTFSGTVVNSYTPASGAVITLIHNGTGEPISGTFLDLPQGATTAIGGVDYTISYTGGTDGRDVTLTAPGTASGPQITSATSLTSTHGHTVGATVVASDTTGGLTYTWTTIHVPPGAKEPTYSTNGKATSGSVIATFYKDGTYNLLCTVKDSAGNAVTTIVQAVVEQKATSLKIEPHGAKIDKKHTEQYVTTILDQFAHPMRTAQTIVYAVSRGGTITQDGLFTAGDKEESLDILVTSDKLSAAIGATIV